MILVVGSINMDINILLDHILRPGETLLCRGSVFKSPGGKGSNQAVAAAKLGAQVVMLGCVGKDENGQQMLDALASSGVDTRYVMIREDQPTSTAYINVAASGENAIAVDSSANMLVSAEYVQSHEDLFRQADYCVFQLEIPVETVRVACALCRKHGVKTVLNPSPMHPEATSLLNGIDYLIPNETEAEQFTGVAVNTKEDCRKAAQKFFEMGVKNVVITLGVRGAYFTDGKEEIFVPAIKVKAVETTGAGDAFNGGFATAIAEGMPVERALQFATCTAAISVTRLGSSPSMPYRHEILALMEKEFGVQL